MTEYHVSPDGHGEPTLWHTGDWSGTHNPVPPVPVLRRCDLKYPGYWDAIVEAMTTKETPVDYEEVWECEVPEEGVGYFVREDEWNDDYTVRVIRRIEIVT